MLPVALTWQRIMSNEIFVKTIDTAAGYLFSWHTSQVNEKDITEEGSRHSCKE